MIHFHILVQKLLYSWYKSEITIVRASQRDDKVPKPMAASQWFLNHSKVIIHHR